MTKVTLRKTNRIKRKIRIRKQTVGNTARPRLSVFRSNKYIYAQIIDDADGKTLLGAGHIAAKKADKKTKTEQAYQIGKVLAKKALEKGITKVSFDRNGYKFHGRVKNLAEGAREGGLQL